MKVLISGPTNTITGYGNDTCELVRAFMSWGADVYLHPTSVHPPVPPDVVSVFAKPIPDEVDLLISHRCPQELAHVNNSGIWSRATVALAWTMWEWDSLAGVDKVDENNCEHAFRVLDNLRSSLSRFDAVLAYDEVSQYALTPFHDKIAVLQGGVDPVFEYKRDWFGSPFRFLMAGALSVRKNPFAAITAFKKLRDAGELKDAELILKTTYPGLHKGMETWCPGLRIIHDAIPENKLFDLYHSCHVLVAPSWGEGKNRPAVQFAMSGGAVVACQVGGHAQWMSPAYAWPLKYEWKEFSPGVRGAFANIDHLAEIMLDLYTDRSSIQVRTQVASRVLPRMVSWDFVLERLRLRLPSLIGQRGVEVAALMSSCHRAQVLSDIPFQNRSSQNEG